MNEQQGTMILDGCGRIRGCGTAAGGLFGGNFSDFAGKPISSLIGALEVSDAARNFGARRLAYLSSREGWHRYDAVDLHGQGFPVELTMSLMQTQDGHDLFLVKLRRPQTD